jgi:quercetin dioxygenase-like cupin family protein
MIAKNTASVAPKVPAAVNGRIMFSDARMEAILLTLLPGESIPEHTNPCDVLFAGIKGKATLIGPEASYPLESGETIFISSEEPRSFKNDTSQACRILVIKIR